MEKIVKLEIVEIYNMYEEFWDLLVFEGEVVFGNGDREVGFLEKRSIKRRV